MPSRVRKVVKPERVSRDEYGTGKEALHRRLTALFGILAKVYGSDRLVLKAGKLGALKGMRSSAVEERVLALQKLVYEDPMLDGMPDRGDVERALAEIEEEIADLVARKSVEDRIERKIAERLQKRHEEYVREIRGQLLKEEAGPENPQTLKKYAHLEKLEQRRLARTALEVLRPSSLAEVVGQERAVKALVAKIASPFPQHVLVYGPPGVGKTTVARLVLEEAKMLRYTPFAADAPFVEVDGATLRWDPREVTNPLLGSVHDPIYQGARREFADGGVPEPKLGLVSEAHGGIMFIDEIGEMDPILQCKLLKVLEDKRVTFDSSYYDPTDLNIPKYVRKLFEEGAPADFVLIGATTRDPEDISPAVRSRCAEVFFEPLTPAHIREIVARAAAKLGVDLEPGVCELVSEYTIEGRKAVNILADAYGLALHRAGRRGRRPLVVRGEEVMEVVRTGRLSTYATAKASDTCEVGKVFALGVSGYLGSVLEIEAIAFAAREKGKGTVRFNEAAGSMAKDSVFNAASVIRNLAGRDVADYDVHVNVVGGGRIDGPSAGLAITMALWSAIEGRPARQDVALTGEVSVRGKVKMVGGLFEKLYGAKQAGVKVVVIPADNAKDVPVDLEGLRVAPVATAAEAAAHVFADAHGGDNIAR